uniref:Uncharacterized protein n=1 Tax=Leersia perrieri TaxID=77586 RepID=A0A0D9VSM7_9ORYZ
MLGCFSRSARGPSPPADESYAEAEVQNTRSTTIKRHRRRPIMEAGSTQPCNPLASAVSRYRVDVALAEALAYEFERRRWFGRHTRRLVGEPKGRARRAPDTSTPRATVDPLVSVTEEENAPAPAVAVVEKERTWFFPPGGYNTQCKPPARITFADRCGAGSLEAFLESVVASRGDGGSASRGVHGKRWEEIVEAKARRQRYLRDYCPFRRDDDDDEVTSVPAAPDEKKTEDDDDEQQQGETTEEETELVVDHAVVEQPANCPAESEGRDDAKGVRDEQARPVRGTDEHRMMRQEFLKSYSLAKKKRTVGQKAQRLSAWRRLIPRRKTAQI